MHVGKFSLITDTEQRTSGIVSECGKLSGAHRVLMNSFALVRVISWSDIMKFLHRGELFVP